MIRYLAPLLLIASMAQAAPPPEGSYDWRMMHEFADWFEAQHNSDGVNCCSVSDGRPLDGAELRIVGNHYEVLFSKRHWPEGTEKWLSVPPGAILNVVSPIGMPVAWIYNGRVLCLALEGGA